MNRGTRRTRWAGGSLAGNWEFAAGHSLAGIDLANTGAINVQSGTLRLPANFSNEGLVTSTGTLAATQIVNLAALRLGLRRVLCLAP